MRHRTDRDRLLRALHSDVLGQSTVWICLQEPGHGHRITEKSLQGLGSEIARRAGAVTPIHKDLDAEGLSGLLERAPIGRRATRCLHLVSARGHGGLSAPAMMEDTACFAVCSSLPMSSPHYAAHSDFETLTVGMPSDTGNTCHLFHRPSRLRQRVKSLPTMSVFSSTSGPLPIMLVSLMGWVSLPSSMRYPVLM